MRFSDKPVSDKPGVTVYIYIYMYVCRGAKGSRGCAATYACMRAHMHPASA